MTNLTDKVAVVTGASRGLGAGIAEVLSADGATVVLTDVLDELGQETAQRLRESGAAAEFIHLDVSDEGSWADVVSATIARHGRLDCLVNNAGVTYPVDIEAASVEQFRRILDVNLIGTFLGIQAGIEAMRRTGGGSIVNIASSSTAHMQPSTSMYGASKAAIANLTKTTAIHCGLMDYGIRVNSVHPGVHETEMAVPRGVAQSPHMTKLIDAIPLGRLGSPLELGKLVAFLLSDDASYITGAEMFADGGVSHISSGLQRGARTFARGDF